MKTQSRLSRAIHAGKQAMAGQQYGVNGTKFLCSICRHDRFKAGLYMAVLMMHPLICSECSHVLLFEKMPGTIEG